MSSEKQNKSLLSLCMIAKNEAEMLGECLARVKPIVDEMIVVDTGSTDETKAIAKEAGAAIYDFTWQDDFSKARNFSIRKARGEWILVLDADEFVSEKDLPIIQTLTARRDVDGFRLCQRSYTDRIGARNFYPCKGEYAEEKGFIGYVTAHLVRLFRNSPDIYFEGHVHEVVESVMHARGKKWISTEIPLHHYGFVKSNQTADQKKALYEKIGRIKTEHMPDDPRSCFDLGVQLIELQKYRKALDVLKRAFALRPDWVPLLFNMGLAHDKLHETEAATCLYEKVLTYEPHHSAALCNLGLLRQRCGRWQDALSAFQKCLEKEPEYLPGLVNLASLLRQNKRFSDAIGYLKKAQSICPGFLPAYYGLALNYRDLKDWVNARQCFERWMEGDGNHELEGRLLLAETCIRQEDWNEVISQCDRTLQLLELPRNMIINGFDDLAKIYSTIADSFNQRGNTHLFRMAGNLASILHGISQVACNNR